MPVLPPSSCCRASPTATASTATCTTSTAKSATPCRRPWCALSFLLTGLAATPMHAVCMAACTAVPLQVSTGADSAGVVAVCQAAPSLQPSISISPACVCVCVVQAAALGRQLRQALEKKAEAEAKERMEAQLRGL